MKPATNRPLMALPPVERRLQQRYQQLVQEHLQIGQRVAAGLNALPTEASSFASTQAAWRFYQNEAVSLPALAQPLIAQGRAAVVASCAQYALVLHDWSDLNYHRHRSKPDRLGSVQSRHQGYELQTALLVSDRTGDPLAPVSQNLVDAKTSHSTRDPAGLKKQTHLDELLGRMDYLATLSFPRPLVHLIDREGDSAGHFRQWEKHRYLVRAKGAHCVQWEGKNWRIADLSKQWPPTNPLVYCRAVTFHGRKARQYVAQTEVVVTRRTRQKRQGQKPTSTAGSPVPLRLIISEVRAESGQVLAVWFLLTNVAAEVAAGQLALWYYWRWRIESFFKLLKGAGQQVEHWQQESALAIAKRLLVVSMACVLVWQLERNPSPAAEELRKVLVRLSGRQTKRQRPCTAPALLEGVWILLSMLELLEHYDLAKLQQLAKTLFPAPAQNDLKLV